METGVLPPATASCVQSYPTVVKQGLIWIWMQPGVSPNTNDISTFDPIDQPGVIHMDFQRYHYDSTSRLLCCTTCSVVLTVFTAAVCYVCCLL
jgi:phenylpropionate dioxygenase-like ring-hydroxylating dioxygenase large terminal subunit